MTPLNTKPKLFFKIGGRYLIIEVAECYYRPLREVKVKELSPQGRVKLYHEKTGETRWHEPTEFKIVEQL